MYRHLAFASCMGLVLLVWIPSFVISTSLFGRVCLIASLFLVVAVFVEAFYEVFQRPRERQRKRRQARLLIEHWRGKGMTRFTCAGKACFDPKDGLFFLDD